MPSGQVTFLFTDIQGSTQLWDSFPDEMRSALAEHNRIMDDVVSAGGGSVVKDTGDGVFAAFRSASNAVTAAVTAQTRISEHDWDPVIGSLEVRMALHTDSVEAIGGDYHGSAINRVARIEAAGHGGQILLSAAAREAAEPALSTGVEVIELGTHRLRGLSETETIFQLVVPGLRATFPPLRTASVLVGRLPEFATSFVGRVVEIEAIAERLSDADCRIVTALGPGGIGKTRLAVEAARRFADTAGLVSHFVSLVGIHTPESIVNEIADSLNFTVDLHVASMVDETSQVLDLLGSQRMVLILDNFEHVLAGAGLVARIAESAPEVKVLVTSRERLGLTGEWVFEVGGLGVANGDPGRPAESIALFIDRANRLGAEISEGEHSDVERLCTLLGGMPLAIELAAAWSQLLPVAEITKEVEASYDFLSGSAPDMPDRHRSIRAAFDYSWSLLSEGLQKAFSKLTIFSSPFTRDAAVAVTGASLSTLFELLNKSLLQRAELDTYEIHPLLREFGLEKLGDARLETARVHGEYYLGRLLARESRLQGSIDQIDVRDEVAAELGNLRQATLWSVHDQSPEETVRAIAALNPFYFLHSWQEAIDHFGEIADAVADLVGSDAAADERYLWARTLAAAWSTSLGETDRTPEEITRLLPHWEQVGGVGLSWALLALGMAADNRGDVAEARVMFERAIENGVGADPNLSIHLAAWYGWTKFEQGDVESAQQEFERGLELANATHNYLGRAYLLSKLGVAADGRGAHEQAAEYHEEGREIFVKTGDLGGQGYALSRLSWSYWLMGDFARAKRYGEEGLEKFEEINHRWGVAASWSRIGLAELGLGNVGAAADAFRTGMEVALHQKMQNLVYYALMGMGRVYAAQGRTDAAVRLLSHNVGLAQNPYANLAQQALDDLADDATEELRAAAGEMTLEEAIALASSE